MSLKFDDNKYYQKITIFIVYIYHGTVYNLYVPMRMLQGDYWPDTVTEVQTAHNEKFYLAMLGLPQTFFPSLLRYCENTFICLIFILVYFVSRTMHEFKISINILFHILVIFCILDVHAISASTQIFGHPCN